MGRDYVPAREAGLQPPADPTPWGSGELAAVVPVISPTLAPDEELALESLRRFAPGVEKILLTPEGLELTFDTVGFVRRTLPSANFDGIAAYNALLLQPWFYRLLSGWGSILIFQLDCVLLREGVEAWAARGFSYVGAPWFGRDGRLKAVGNGGLSLRRPADMLAVLESGRLHMSGATAQVRRQFGKPKHLAFLLRTLCAAQGEGPLGARLAAAFGRPEDEFWSFYAPLLSPAYRLPAPAEAALFAAEASPSRITELNGGTPPLGGHAWARHERDFWEAQFRIAGLAD